MYIDSLRGLAILMVVLVHTAQSVKGLSYYSERLSKFGQMGVQLLFVLSAYTLCLSTEKRIDEKHSIKSFY